jgi:DNA repair protein RadC
MKILREINNGPAVCCSKDVHLMLKEFVGEMQEHFIVIGLDNKNKPLYRRVVSIGGMTQCIVEPRDVFRQAIVGGASRIMVAHNHPSGDPTPSPEDLTITERLVKAGELLGIEVLDHVILGDSFAYSSLRDLGLIK